MALSTPAPAKVAPAPAPVAPVAGGQTYTVQKGDTFDEIVRKLGARRQDVINANKLTDPSRIQVGQTLFIPSPPAPAAK